MKKTLGLIFFLVLAINSQVLACAVCFGGADGNLRRGFTWGVLLLGLLPFVLLAGFIFTIVRASRRHQRPL